MKPRKKQRVESEGKHEISGRKRKPKDVDSEDPEDSLEDEGLEELIDDEGGEDDLDDEMAIEDEPDSEEDERDDFQDVKSKKRKKQSKDPASFANAMSAILSSSLKAHTRADPILVRSKSQSKSIESAKTDYRIRKAVAAQKKALRSIGHIEDLSTYDAKELEYERTMKKTAQRGVVRLFNAVRASQIKGEQALLEAKGAPRAEREEKVQEMSREGFLNLIKSG